MSDNGGCRLQLCGPLYACVRGVDVTSRLPAGQARTLFAYLVLQRDQPQSRVQLIDALWPLDPPAHADRDVAALLSRLRGVFGSDHLPVGSLSRLVLPADASVDIDDVFDHVSRAEVAVAEGDHAAAWREGRSAVAIARRGFLPDVHLPWAQRVRERLAEALLRAYDAVGEAALGLGGPEIATAQQMGQEIVALSPLRESGYRLVMRACVARGNPAEALLVYDAMRRQLAEHVGVDPGPESRALFAQILAGSTAAAGA